MFRPIKVLLGVICTVICTVIFVGCGDTSSPETSNAQSPNGESSSGTVSSSGGASSGGSSSAVPAPPQDTTPRIQARSVLGERRNGTASSQGSSGSSNTLSDDPGQSTSEPDSATGTSSSQPSGPQMPARSLGELLRQGSGPFVGERMEIDPDRVQAAGVERVSGLHLDLYSDVRDSARLTELVKVFDAAVPWWCERFEIDPTELSDWRVTGFLIQDAGTMRRAGLMPDDLPPFPNGYYRGYEFWFYDQPSDFYRRCLMLHEGTHAFMYQQLGGAGPPWYLEGMAERLAVHRWDGETLEMDVRLRDRDEAPLWGRVRIIQDAFAEGKGYMPETLFLMDNEEFLKNESYGWAWAMCEFFGNHPDHQQTFKQLAANVADRSATFAEPLVEPFRDRWDVVREDWQMFIGEMDYGYDIQRMALVHRPSEPLGAGAETIEIVADRGWQSSGFTLEAGTYEFTATGSYLMRTGDEEWPSEPDGISIDYYRGEPVGKVLIGLRGDDDLSKVFTALLQPTAVGKQMQIRFDRAGELFFRINDHPSSLADNSGTASITVRRVR